MSLKTLMLRAAAGDQTVTPPEPSDTYGDTVLADSPAVFLKMDETSGTVAEDATANNNDGTISGGVLVGQQPIIAGGAAMSFDGVIGSYITLTDNATIDFGDTFTIEVWAVRAGTGASHAGSFFARGANGPLVGFDGVTGAVVIRKQGVADVVASNVVVLDTNLHHYVFTKSGATSKIYIDGVDRTGTVTNQTMADVAVNPRIGSDHTDGRRFQGRMDELAAYPTALTAARVLAHYQAGPAAPPIDPPPPTTFTPLFSGDFSTNDLSQWYQYLRVNSLSEPGGRMTLVSSPATPLGNKALRIELRSGDSHDGVVQISNGSLLNNGDGTSRCGLRCINYGNHFYNAGESRYFRFAVRLPLSLQMGGSFSNPWRGGISWPSAQDGTFSPLKFQFDRELNGAANPNGTDAITCRGDLGVAGAGDQTQWRLQNPVRDQWYEFIVHIVFSGSSSTGRWEFWLRQPGGSTFVKQTFNAGTLKDTDVANIRTLSGTTATSNQRFSMYRNKSFTTTDVIYYGDFYMGNSLASVGGT